MDHYIGTKLIQAEPCLRKIPSSCPLADNGFEPGYKVRYADGYESWSPKEVFEKAYMKVIPNPNLRTNAPSISQEMVDGFISKVEVTTMGDKCTVVRAILKNGFEIVESSACVSAENYDEKLGTEICMKKVEDKVWFLLGFLLQTAVNGI